MSIKIVEALSKSVKIIIETRSEAMIIYGLFLSSDRALLPSISGKTGNTQGAKIVNTHAKNDKINSSIFIVDYY
jgi:hypothetical protein